MTCRCGKQHVLPCDPAEQRDPLWVDNAIALYGINEARRARAKEASEEQPACSVIASVPPQDQTD